MKALRNATKFHFEYYASPADDTAADASTDGSRPQGGLVNIDLPNLHQYKESSHEIAQQLIQRYKVPKHLRYANAAVKQVCRQAWAVAVTIWVHRMISIMGLAYRTCGGLGISNVWVHTWWAGYGIIFGHLFAFMVQGVSFVMLHNIPWAYSPCYQHLSVAGAKHCSTRK